MPKKGWVKADLNQTVESGARGEGAHFSSTCELKFYTFDSGKTVVVFSMSLDNLDDLDGQYYNRDMTVGNDSMWDFEGMQLYRRDETISLISTFEFYSIFLSSLKEAAAGTEFEDAVNSMFESGDLSPVTEMEFIAKVVPVIGKDNKPIMEKSKKDGKEYPRSFIMPAEILKLSGVKKAKATKKSTKAAVKSEEPDEEALAAVGELLTGLVDKAAFLVKTKLKSADIEGFGPEVLDDAGLLAELGLQVKGNKLVALD